MEIVQIVYSDDKFQISYPIKIAKGASGNIRTSGRHLFFFNNYPYNFFPTRKNVTFRLSNNKLYEHPEELQEYTEKIQAELKEHEDPVKEKFREVQKMKSSKVYEENSMNSAFSCIFNDYFRVFLKNSKSMIIQ